MDGPQDILPRTFAAAAWYEACVASCGIKASGVSTLPPNQFCATRRKRHTMNDRRAGCLYVGWHPHDVLVQFCRSMKPEKQDRNCNVRECWMQHVGRFRHRKCAPATRATLAMRQKKATTNKKPTCQQIGRPLLRRPRQISGTPSPNILSESECLTDAGRVAPR